MLFENRFDTNETPEVFSRNLATPKLQSAFLMLDAEYAKKKGLDKEHEKISQRGAQVRSGMGHANNEMGKDPTKAFDLYLRFRESSSAALYSGGTRRKAKSMAEVIAEIDAMSMETVMFSDAHMLETQIQQLTEIKKYFTSGDSEEEGGENATIEDKTEEVVLQSSRGARILLAAHKTSGTLISRWLVRSDFKVKKANDGDQAWKYLQEQTFDLLVCDANLGGHDGLELTEMIRKSEKGLRHMPVILMSSSKLAEQAYSKGVNDFLSKPVGKRHLLKKVGTVLENAFYKRMIRNYQEITGNKGDTKFDYDPSRVEIMIVDDDIVTRKLVSRWLKSTGYKTILCKNGVEAWKGIQGWANEVKTTKTHTRMILSDVTMPELSGFKLLEWVMSDKNTKDIPIILMSAVHTDQGGKERSIQSGSQDFLVKPFTKQLLLHKVKTIMETITTRRNRHVYAMLRLDNTAMTRG